MSVTVASLYSMVCFDLLEDGGLTLGLVTQQQFLDYLGEVLMDYLRKTGVIWSVSPNQRTIAGTSQYVFPDSMTEVYFTFVNAKILEQVDLTSEYLAGTFKYTNGIPAAWHADGLPVKTVELVPPPNWTGSATTGTPFQPGGRNVTFVGPCLASKETWGSGDTLDTIPDSLTPYLVFGVLAKIFSTDGETKDNARAAYCENRYQEGCSLGASILKSVMIGEQQ